MKSGILCLLLSIVTLHYCAQSQQVLIVEGTSNSTYQVERSSDLANWRLFTKFVHPGVAFTIKSPEVDAAQHWYYRTLQTNGADRVRLYARLSKEESFADFVWVPPGEFIMGSPSKEQDRYATEGPQTRCVFTYGYYIQRHEVTRTDWLTVMGFDPSYWRDSMRQPVSDFKYADALEYCRRLTTNYQTSGAIPSDWAFRLPYEAEWERACRAGTTTRFCFGNDLEYQEVGDYCWYAANSNLRLQEVGRKLPNAWGIFDMHGNIAEWCLDWSGSYPGGVVTNWTGPASGTVKMIRGSSYLKGPELTRSARRASLTPVAGHNYGFRVVLAPVHF